MTLSLLGVGGIQVRETDLAVRRFQFRFPRTKKKRIRAKWSKREENFRQEPLAYLCRGILYAHPQIVRRLRKEFSEL